jgi:hypothetical protein
MEGGDWEGELSVLDEEDLSGDRNAEVNSGPEVSFAFSRLSENEKRQAVFFSILLFHLSARSLHKFLMHRGTSKGGRGVTDGG